MGRQSILWFPDVRPMCDRREGNGMTRFHRAASLFVAMFVLSTGLAGLVALPAGAAPAADVAGTGAGIARPVNAATLPAAGLRVVDPAAPVQQDLRANRATAPSRPDAPSRGTKPSIPAQSNGVNTTGVRAITPQVSVVSNFAGLDQAAGCGNCQPPDVNAAVGATQIVETVNNTLRVYSKTGVTACTFLLSSFLGTTDSLTDPRVLYDNLNARWLFSITLRPASTTSTPAIWAAASQGSNPCAGWTVYRLTFSGGSYPAGTFLDQPRIGQDRNALLMATDNFTPTSGLNFTVFGIQKSQLYSGARVSFSAFNTASRVTPASNAGIPMVATSASYFLGSVPGTGYRLYKLTNSGGTGAVLTLQATISSSFNAPSRQVKQPGTTTTLDPSDGRIAWSPMFDGTFLWFAHGFDLAGFPTVRYGAINVNTNGVTVAIAYHNGTSDDFNPSIAIGLNPGGGAFIFVNWAYTDSTNNIAVSDTVNSVNPGGGVPNLIGTDTTLITGSTTGQTRFGDYSSAAIDPANTNGSCAVTAQQYFVSGGSWATRIGRVGTC
jgi:hypothetical protein